MVNFRSEVVLQFVVIIFDIGYNLFVLYIFMISREQKQASVQIGNEHHICSHMNLAYNLDQAFLRHSTESKQQNRAMEVEKEEADFCCNDNSSKGECEVCETSFQKDLLKEHIEVAQKNLPLLFISDFPSSQVSTSFKLEQPAPPQPNDAQTIQFIQTEFEKLCGEEEMKSWKCSRFGLSLIIFLAKACKGMRQSVIQRVTALTYQIWSNYLQIQDDGQDLAKLLTNAIEIADSIADNWLLEQKTILNIEALRIYCTTIILVGNQYFQNPYFDCLPPRQPPNDSSDSDLSPDKPKPSQLARPRKRRHEDLQGQVER